MTKSFWILEALGRDRLERARKEAIHSFDLSNELTKDPELRFTAAALELAVFELLDDEEQTDKLRSLSEETFKLQRVLPVPESPIDAGKWFLRLACLGVLGGRDTEIAHFLEKNTWPELPTEDVAWRTRVLASVLDAWLRLIRKAGEDLELAQKRIVVLRQQQPLDEKKYLRRNRSTAPHAVWELVALHQMAKTAEFLATFLREGAANRKDDTLQQLKAQFDCALTACAMAQHIEIKNLSRLLSRTAKQLVADHIS